MKTLDDYFTDWESHVFGYGYGTGERPILKALRTFFVSIKENGRSYDYTDLEEALGPTITWLLINTLCHADILEYGTSPRFGWLTTTGQRLRAFVLSKTLDDLEALTCRDEDYDVCYPDACNCGPKGYEEGRVCQNPFWLKALGAG